MPPSNQRPRSVSKQQLPQKWTRGLCDCCEDPTLACTTYFCSCNAVGQLYQRLTKEPRCQCIAAVLWFLFLLSSVLSTIGQIQTQTAVRKITLYIYEVTVVDWNQITTGMILSTIAGSVGFTGTVLATYALCVSRKRMRARDRIPIQQCGDLEDCCVSSFCSCCVINQMFAQEKVSGTTYSLFSVIGTSDTTNNQVTRGRPMRVWVVEVEPSCGDSNEQFYYARSNTFFSSCFY